MFETYLSISTNLRKYYKAQKFLRLKIALKFKF